VYVIRCKATNWRYVGSSASSIENRWSWHRANLRGGKYSSDNQMMKDWLLYGEPSFQFSVAKYCVSREDCLREETRLIKYWMARGLCYNRHPTAYGPKGSKHSEDSKIKISIASKSRCTPQWRKAVSERVKRQHAAGKLGQTTWSEGIKETTYKKIGDALRGRVGPTLGQKRTPEQRERYRLAALRRETARRDGDLPSMTGAAHWNYGKPSPMKGRTWTAAQRDNMRIVSLRREANKRNQQGGE
jgi:group I intron endonuclease